jgi:hypothetical protein
MSNTRIKHAADNIQSEDLAQIFNLFSEPRRRAENQGTGQIQYNKTTGSNLKAPVPHPKTKADDGRKKVGKEEYNRSIAPQ